MVDPIKHTLKAPGPQHLKLEYDKLLSAFAFKFNLRRITESAAEPSAASESAAEVGRCRLTLSNSR